MGAGRPGVATAPDRIANLQGLRGSAVLLVVLFHIAVVEQRHGNGAALLADYLAVGTAGVDLFFVISGFVMVTVTRGKFQQLPEVADFVYHRMTRIYPLYWFYTALTLGVYLILPHLAGNPERLAAHDIVASFLLLPQSDLPLVIVGWTLVHEVYFYAVFTLLLLLPEYRFGTGLLVWGLGVCAGNWLVEQGFYGATPAMELLAHPLTWEFIAGCWIARLIDRGLYAQSLTVLLTGIGLLALGLWLYRPVTFTDIPEGWLRIVIFGMPCVLIVYGAVALERRSGWMLPGWLRLIGDASYSIYLSHVLVIAALGKLWSWVARPGPIDNLVAVPLLLAAVLGVGLGSYGFLEKPLLALSRRAKSRALGLTVRLS